MEIELTDKELLLESYNRLIVFESQLDMIKNIVYKLENQVRSFRGDWLESRVYKKINKLKGDKKQ